jgi:hypothetical protein
MCITSLELCITSLALCIRSVAMDTLRAGVPMLTMAGDGRRFAARMGVRCESVYTISDLKRFQGVARGLASGKRSSEWQEV